MGKAKKKNRNAHRFDPLARPAPMQVDGDEAEAPKAPSAHQQRHLERKRLQAEQQSLKQQRRKVSKANLLTHKKETKALSKSLRTLKDEAAALRERVPAAVASKPLTADALSGFAFDLPMPGLS